MYMRRREKRNNLKDMGYKETKEKRQRQWQWLVQELLIATKLLDLKIIKVRIKRQTRVTLLFKNRMNMQTKEVAI